MSADEDKKAVRALFGLYAELEPDALTEAQMILHSAMRHGFKGPLDIPTERFPETLREGAAFIRRASEAGAEDYADVLRELMHSGLPEDTRDRIKSMVLKCADHMHFPPAKMERSAKVVLDFHVIKMRQKAAWDIHEILEKGEDPEEAICRYQQLGISGLPSSVKESLRGREFQIDSPPVRPEPVFSLRGLALCTAGNVSNIQALPKAGKSAVVEALVAATLVGVTGGPPEGPVPDTLGFTARNPQEKALIHFDTEQSHYDHHALVRRAVERAGDCRQPSWLHSYAVADLGVLERMECLRTALKMAEETDGGVMAVLLDGIGDLCTNPNDAEEAFALVAELHTLAIRHDCVFVTVLHENPGSETGKTRGHLGSQLERKAETNLRLAKDAHGITTMWTDRARHCHLPKSAGPCFAWNTQKRMHTSCGTAGEIKRAAARDTMEDESRRVFGEKEALRYGALLDGIANELGLKERASSTRVQKWSAEGIIRKDDNGIYHLVSP